MCVVYLLSPETKMRFAGSRLIIEREGRRLSSLLLGETECVVQGRCATVTTPTVYALLSGGIPLFFVDGRGRVLGQMGTRRLSFERSCVQHDFFTDAAHGLACARETVGRKIIAQRELLRSYAKSRHGARLTRAVSDLKIYRAKLSGAQTVDELRGFEGAASRRYFEAFPDLLGEPWSWAGRSRRPPRDPVNALLSYGYAFLEREVRLAILGAGLDARFGFLHANNGRKDSLVFDLMEPFRPAIIDRFVLRALNRREFHIEEFETTEEQGCRLAPAARTRFIARYEEAMTREAAGHASLRESLRLAVRNFAAEMFCVAATRKF